MTHVILIDHNENEQHISFQTPETFTGFLKAVRQIQPDRTWSILESFEK
jgi:hypothetical protein